MAKAGIKLTEKDLGWNALRDQVLKLSRHGAFCTVGVQGSSAAAGHKRSPELTVAAIAEANEFGKVIRVPAGVDKRGRRRRAYTITIPQRSFIRAAIDEYRGAIQKRATLLGTGAVLLKFSTIQALELLGAYAVGIMQQRIANRIGPPNHPRTIARKKSSVPLIDSGQLRGSITYKVEAS